MTTAGVGPNWHLHLYPGGLIQVPDKKKKIRSTHDPELFLTLCAGWRASLEVRGSVIL